MIQEIQPLPDDVIQQWEDYCFMHNYEERNRQIYNDLAKAYNENNLGRRASTLLCPSLRIFSPRMNDDPLVSIEALRALLTRAPHFARVFQARWLLYHPSFFSFGFFDIDGQSLAPAELFFIRILLDLSWVDMRAAICSLRPILGKNARKFREMLLVLPTLCSEIYPESFTSRDLALGFLRLTRKMCCGDLSLNIW